MADKINIEIDLEGGAEVVKQLDEIGQSGQKAFGDIQNAADQIDLGNVTNALDNVQTAVQGAASLEKLVQGLGKIQNAFESVGNAAEKMAVRMTKSLGVLGVFARSLGPVGIAIGVIGGAFVKFGDSAADALNKITVSAAKLGQTPQQFDRLETALGRLGISADAIGPGIEKFQAAFGNLNQLEGFIAQLERMPDSVRRTQLAIQTLGEALGGQVIAGLQAGTITAESFRQALAGVNPVTQEQIVNAAKYQIAINQLAQAWRELIVLFQPITTPIFEFLIGHVRVFIEDLKKLRLEIAFSKGVWDVFVAGIKGQDVEAAAKKAAEEYKKLEQQLKGTGQAGADTGLQTTQGLNATTAAAQQTNQALAQTGQIAAQAGEQGAQAFNRLNNSMVAGIQVILDYQAALRRLAWYQNLPRPTSVQQGLRPDVIAPGMASGGLLGGSGTGTSDSNLAWVSRGEHIMPARAVAQPGVLAFLEALRRSGGNLRGVLDGLGRFALGGLVPRTLPSFASGGAVGSMSNVIINFPGLPPIGGLRATAGVVDELHKMAALAQVRSGGRKPSRYT